jgi:hypothetical protein
MAGLYPSYTRFVVVAALWLAVAAAVASVSLLVGGTTSAGSAWGKPIPHAFPSSDR